ncbi:MAG TPA: hypothetical protein VF954_03610 [Acidimicrobiales bacterium]
MSDTLEGLQSVDQSLQYVIQLLNQAVQCLDQLLEWNNQNQPDHQPDKLQADLADLQRDLHAATDSHNALAAKIGYMQQQLPATQAGSPEGAESESEDSGNN